MEMKRKALIVFVTLVLLIHSAGAVTEKRFSRSRWIAERMPYVWFSGGLLPLAEPKNVPVADEPGPADLLSLLRIRNVRISRDILPGLDGSGQPEMQTEPMISLNPEDPDNFIAGYQDNRFNDGGARALTYAFSQNAGRTWEEGLVPNLTIASGGLMERASDPWVAFGPENRVYYASIAFNEIDPLNGVFINVSTDGGRTFGDPVAVATSTRVFNDKEAVAVDNGIDSPYRGNVYVGWDTVASDNTQIALIARSKDGGQSFSTPKKLTRNGLNIGVVPVVGPDGTVYAIWVQFIGTQAQIVFARSKNGGRKWSKPHMISDFQLQEVPELRTGSVLHSAALDPVSGAIYVVWQDGRFANTVQVAISRSLDKGKTWSAPQRVSEPDDRHHFTPAVAVNDAGQIGVSYYALPQGSFFSDLRLSVSNDNGRTFNPDLRITSKSFDVRFAASVLLEPSGSAFFLGDYQGIAGGMTAFHPLWIATFKKSKLNSGKQADAFTASVQP